MKENSGRIINFTTENTPIFGCTVSKQIYWKNDNEISVFSLANNTDISAECYLYHKLIFVLQGTIEVFSQNCTIASLNQGESIITPTEIPVGIKAHSDCVYIEIGFRKDTIMNEIIKSAEIFKLNELLPYQEGKIINMDIAHNDRMKFVVMSFDSGTGLSEHAAPGEALVMALEGEAVIGYEGKDYLLKAGETFKFDKFGKHSVTAAKRFKMALLLVLE